MSSPFLYFIAIISFLFTQECISFDGENAILANNEKKVEKEKLSKRPYLHSPSYISLGFDLGQFLWNFITYNPKFFFEEQEKYKFDFRGNFLIDFNRLLISLDIGFLKKTNTMQGLQYQKHSLLLRINCFCNFIKKNSEHNSIFIGGGININGSKESAWKYSIEEGKWEPHAKNEKFSWFWLNVAIGFRKSFCKKTMYFGGNFILNFCKKELYTKEKDYCPITQELIYGFGKKDSSITPSFNLYIGGTIPLKTKDKRVMDEEFYFYNDI